MPRVMIYTCAHLVFVVPYSNRHYHAVTSTDNLSFPSDNLSFPSLVCVNTIFRPSCVGL